MSTAVHEFLSPVSFATPVPVASGGTGAANAPAALANLGVVPSFVQSGRLTLTSGNPLPTSDVTGASTIYFTPWRGDSVAIFNGLQWVPWQFSEISLALSGLTSGKNYDVFAYQGTTTPVLAVRAVGGNNTNGNTTAVQKPAGVVAGDLLFVFVDTNSGTISATSGWQLSTVLTSGANSWAIYWRLATNSEPASYALNVTGETYSRAIAVQNPNQTDGVSIGIIGQLGTWPSLSTTTANALVLGMSAVDNTTGGSGWTSVFSYTYGGSASHPMSVWRSMPASAGAITAPTPGSNARFLIAINPQPSTPVAKIDLGTAWTNDTTRALAVSRKNGIQVNDAQFTGLISSATIAQYQGTYLGTIRTTGTSTTEDSAANRFVSQGDRNGSMMYQDSRSVAITGGTITGIADLAVADGGTGAGTATGALQNLGCAWQKISETAINSAIAAFTQTGLSAYRMIRVSGWVVPATNNVNFGCRLSTNNGSSYDSTSTRYTWRTVFGAAGLTGTGSSSSDSTRFYMQDNIANSGGLTFDMNFKEFNQGRECQVQWVVQNKRQGGTDTQVDFGGGYYNQTTARDAFQLAFSSGNISVGHILVEGLV